MQFIIQEIVVYKGWRDTWVGGGGHSNTGIVHMGDQRFSKHTIQICPFEEKHHYTRILCGFVPNLPPFLNTFCGIEFQNDLNTPLIYFRKDPFSWKQAHFDPKSQFWRIVFSLKNNPFLRFSCCACVQYSYWVPPPPHFLEKRLSIQSTILELNGDVSGSFSTQPP